MSAAHRNPQNDVFLQWEMIDPSKDSKIRMKREYEQRQQQLAQQQELARQLELAKQKALAHQRQVAEQQQRMQQMQQQLAQQQRINEENERRRQRELAEQRRVQQENERRQRQQLLAANQSLLVNQRTLVNAVRERMLPLQQEMKSVEGEIEEQEQMVYPMDEVKCDENVNLWVTLGITGDGKSTLCNRLFGDKSRKGNKGPFEAKRSGQSGYVFMVFCGSTFVLFSISGSCKVCLI